MPSKKILLGFFVTVFWQMPMISMEDRDKSKGFSMSEGGIELIVGEMFCGKTEELIRRLIRAEIAKQRVQAFKPAIDTRYGEHFISTHYGQRYKAQPIGNILELPGYIDMGTKVVGIDEGQFFSSDIVSVCESLANEGIRVIVNGLNSDYLGNTFGAMGELLAHADLIQRLHAICTVCGKEASHTQRIVSGDDAVILIGGLDKYEARCRMHWEPLKVPV